MNINDIAISFKENQSPRLFGDIYKFVRQKYFWYITKRCSQNCNPTDDTETIITEMMIRLHQNISTWDPTSCKFTTWIYSSINLAIRRHQTDNFRSSNRVTYPDVLIEHSEEQIDMNAVEFETTELVFKYDYIESEQQMQWCCGTMLFDTDTDLIEFFGVTDFTTVGGKAIVNGRVMDTPIMIIHRDNVSKNKMMFVQKLESNYKGACDEISLVQRKKAVIHIINEFIPIRYRSFMMDYLAGASHDDLSEKYKIGKDTVATWVFINKKNIRKYANAI